MPYEFAENEFELEPQSSAARSGGPPLKRSGIGVLDPPGSIPATPTSKLFRIIAGIVLFTIAVALIAIAIALR